MTNDSKILRHHFSELITHLPGTQKKDPTSTHTARYHREWYKAGMGNIRKWPEKLRRLMGNEVTQTVIGIVLALAAPAVGHAMTNALVTWVWSDGISTGYFVLLSVSISILFFAIVLIVLGTFPDSPQTHIVDKDS